MVQEFDPIITKRLKLRRFKPEDGETFWQYRTNEAVAKYQGAVSGFSKSMAANFAREQSVQKFGVPGSWFQVAIELRSTGKIIGDCGIHTLDDDPQQVELGITIAAKFQKKGYARETLESVLAYVFDELKKTRVIALTDPDNVASIRLIESLGMQREALLERHVLVRGKWMDDLRYVISAEQWQESKI